MFYPGLWIYLHLEIKMRILSHWQVQNPFFNGKRELQHEVFVKDLYRERPQIQQKNKILEANKRALIWVKNNTFVTDILSLQVSQV